MHAVKRLELFISEGWLATARQLLDKAGHGYSVLPVLLGHGGRGDRRLGDISGDGNVCLVAAMSEAEVEACRAAQGTPLQRWRSRPDQRCCANPRHANLARLYPSRPRIAEGHRHFFDLAVFVFL